MSTLTRPFLVLALFCCTLAPAFAAPVYVALGASDATGVGASNYNEADPSQRNNGYVYRIHDAMRARYAPWALVNLGISGATAPSIQQNALGPAIAQRPAIVTMWAGGNDVKNSVLAGESVETLKTRFEAAYTDIIRRLRLETGAFIVTANLPDMSRLPIAYLLTQEMRDKGKESSIALNEVIARVAAAYDVPVVDMYNDPESYDWGSYSWDGFHPNDAGYARMAARYEEILRRDAWRVVSGLGDVDGNGAVTILDASEALRAAGGLRPLDERAAMAADTAPSSGNGVVGIADALRILHRSLARIPDADWR